MRFMPIRRSHATRVPVRRRMMVVAGTSIALLACAGVVACGGSSSNTSASANASAAGGATGATGRFASIRACLQKQGITLPQRPAGTRPPGGFGSGQRPPGGSFLPNGVSRTKFREALQKCGGGNFHGGRFFNGAAGKAALEKFAACMRENGVNVPKPNTSGNGPVFNTSGINTQSAAFRTAEARCRSELPRTFGGAANGGPPPGAPNGPGGATGSETPPAG